MGGCEWGHKIKSKNPWAGSETPKNPLDRNETPKNLILNFGALRVPRRD